MPKTWTVEAIVSLTHKALSLLSSFGQLELLTILHNAEFHSIEPEGQAPLHTVLSKATCLQRTDIYLDFSLLWPQPRCVYEESILHGLINRKLFAKAQEFCALCHLPPDQIIVSQWTELIAQEKYRTDLEFWRTIEEDFKKNNISHEVGFEFFTHQSDRIQAPVDRYKCLKLGLDRSSDLNAQLYRRLYFICLDEAFDLSHLNECWSFNPTVTSHKMDVSDTTHRELSASHHSRLNLLIASMLDRGDLYSASLVSLLFEWEHSDCLLLEQMAKACTQHESGEGVLSQLAGKLRHGKSLAVFFLAAYRLLCSLGKVYLYYNL